MVQLDPAVKRQRLSSSFTTFYKVFVPSISTIGTAAICIASTGLENPRTDADLLAGLIGMAAVGLLVILIQLLFLCSLKHVEIDGNSVYVWVNHQWISVPRSLIRRVTELPFTGNGPVVIEFKNATPAGKQIAYLSHLPLTKSPAAPLRAWLRDDPEHEQT